ncbi:hypothetical protein DUNSADRAFT_5941, partial [Dunaliella salina]
MGYQYAQNAWQAVGGDASAPRAPQYVQQKLDEDMGEYSFFYTGDCAYGDVVAGETVGLILSDSCFNARPFICQARYDSSSVNLLPIPPSAPPLAPPTTTVGSPPRSPAPPTPEAPFPPTPSIPPPEQRSTCYNWRVLKAPAGATLSNPTAETTEVQGAMPGKYKFALIMADSDGSQDTVTVDSTVEASMLTYSPPSTGTTAPSAPTPSPSSFETSPPARCQTANGSVVTTTILMDMDINDIDDFFASSFEVTFHQNVVKEFPSIFELGAEECIGAAVKDPTFEPGSVVARIDSRTSSPDKARQLKDGLTSYTATDFEENTHTHTHTHTHHT